MKRALYLFAGLLLPAFAQAANFIPVCDRSAGFVAFIEGYLEKPCSRIGEHDLGMLWRQRVEVLDLGFKSGDFSGVSAAHIEITSNGGTDRWPEDLFKELDGLDMITIRDKQLKRVPRAIVKMGGPATLVIEAGPDFEWTPGAFKGLRRTSVLELAGLSRVSSDPTVLADIPRLAGMIVRDSSFEKLDLSMFSRAREFHYLTFNNVRLGRLAALPGAHEGLILSVDFRGGEVGRVETGAFRGLKELDMVVFHNTKVDLAPGAFRGSGLKRLLLMASHLPAIRGGTFRGALRGDIEVSIIDSAVDKLKSGAFDGAEIAQFVLRRPDVSGFGLVIEPRAFAGSRGATPLIFKLVPIAELQPGAFDGVTWTPFIDLAFTGLERIPDGLFARITDLTAVSVEGNPLTQTGPGAFQGNFEVLEMPDTLGVENDGNKAWGL